MSDCEKVRIPHKKVCIGDLKYKISLQKRTLKKEKNGPDIKHEFVEFKKPWAAIKTLTGSNLFSGVNQDRRVSHVFYIRYFQGLTAESWIEFKSKRYDIVDIENLGENDEFYAIYANERGNSNLKSTTF